MGWFATLDRALLVATTERGDQIDLLVVPPGTTAATAQRAMSMAADPANVLRAQGILEATRPRRPDPGSDDGPQ
jgi:hypothetical protein